MQRCSTCGAEHKLLDPAFRRPEQYVRLAPELRQSHAKASDDLCRISLPEESTRYFVRGVLPVTVFGYPDGVWWGVWAEVAESSFNRIIQLWSEADQKGEPLFQGELANLIPSYPNTLGLRLFIRLTGPTSRPEFRFDAGEHHPFVSECEAGVDAHRAIQWNELIPRPS
jgi:hypothetical protein